MKLVKLVVVFFFVLNLLSLKAGMINFLPDASLEISGAIEKKDYQLIEKHLNATKKIILNDVGSGEVDVYLPLANKIFQKKLPVEVKNACIATCVYLFLAGSKKSLKDGFIGVTESTSYYVNNWNLVHEQFENPDKKASKEKLLAELKRIAKIETDFMSKIKMKDDLFYALPKVNYTRGEKAFSFLVLKPETLKKFGVTNLEGQMKVTSVLFGEDVAKNPGLYQIQ